MPAPFWKKGDIMTKIADFPAAKSQGRKLSMLTCYDACFAALLQDSGIDSVLVGDSAAMVVHGRDSTLHADIDMIAAHVRAVRAGGPGLSIVADMPFLSTRRGCSAAVEAAGALMQAGADAVKIEGLRGHEEIIPFLIDSGIPVMGHLGLTPQSVHVFGGYRVQGREQQAADRIAQDAAKLEELGCFSIVLECVPSHLSSAIADDLTIPIIGIGAGEKVDGQILVLQDLLGLGSGRVPRFVREYLDGRTLVRTAIDSYISDIKDGSFPDKNEQYLFPSESPAAKRGGN